MNLFVPSLACLLAGPGPRGWRRRLRLLLPALAAAVAPAVASAVGLFRRGARLRHAPAPLYAHPPLGRALAPRERHLCGASTWLQCPVCGLTPPSPLTVGVVDADEVSERPSPRSRPRGCPSPRTATAALAFLSEQLPRCQARQPSSLYLGAASVSCRPRGLDKARAAPPPTWSGACADGRFSYGLVRGGAGGGRGLALESIRPFAACRPHGRYAKEAQQQVLIGHSVPKEIRGAGGRLGAGAASEQSERAITVKDALADVLRRVDAQKEMLQQRGSIGHADEYDQLKHFLVRYADEIEVSGTMTAQQFVDVMMPMLRMRGDRLEFPFSPFHKAVREPFDLQRWGMDCWKPLVDMEHSKLEGMERLNEIQQWVDKGDNVIFFSNHQIEPDPQVIRLILQRVGFPDLSAKLIFVAGHRVRTDPLSIPFSLGCNLFCVHSKKHIEHPPEEKEQKTRENLLTIKAIQRILAEGGKIVWVAPSGGRDRPTANGQVDRIAKFDPKTVQLFRLIASKATERVTHFIPMALATAAVCPPPPTVSLHKASAAQEN
eukprot:GHVT01013870.1.p1 GENE.GHVT01013870.1~~GHVT01013870.1.p1  ORF type:complete len:547 (+),score=103.15 GHVT01013870.1:520-2160(+)